MSKKLKRIVNSLAAQDDAFLVDDLHRILEKRTNEAPKFTGFYADEEGAVFTTKAWSQKLISKKKEAQAKRLEAHQEEVAKEQEVKKSQTMRILIGAGILLIGALLFFLSDFDSEGSDAMPPPAEVSNAQQDSNVDTYKPVSGDTLYGNAIITGANVNMRAGANLEAEIIDFFPDEGERVRILQAATKERAWFEVIRKDGSKGWVFEDYVSKTE